MAIGDGRVLEQLSQREHLLIAAAKGYRPNMSELPSKLGAIQSATRALTAGGVPHALIGGLAVGVPRATLDVDFAVPSRAEKPALIALLVEAGFAFVGEFPHSLNFKHASGEPLQLAFDAPFDEMIVRAEPVEWADVTLYVVTRDDLLLMKRRAAADPAGRRSKALRDQADIALLEGDVPEEGEGW